MKAGAGTLRNGGAAWLLLLAATSRCLPALEAPSLLRAGQQGQARRAAVIDIAALGRHPVLATSETEASCLQLSFLFGGEEDESPLGLLGSLAAMLLAPIGAMLLQLGVSRQREYLADATAARILAEGAPLADALQAIDRSHAPALTGSRRLMAPMYIVNPLAGGHLAALFSTHPPLRERIRRLRAYDSASSPAPRSSASSRSPARAHTGAPLA